MNYKIIFLFFFLILNSCINTQIEKKEKIFTNKAFFVNKGFTLIYSEDLKKNNLISNKLNERALTIFQKNLKADTHVKITNLINQKYIIAKVGKNASYPNFFNSVISNRIGKELEIDRNEPYVEIKEIHSKSLFIAKKAKMFDEEKQVADKAPIDSISINDLNSEFTKTEQVKQDKFNYSIKIADFYFKDTALTMFDRIEKETSVNKIGVQTLSNTHYRVFLGPFYNINSLQKAFNDINVLQFENIEIIKNDKNN